MAAALAMPCAASAQARRFDVPAGPLPGALVTLGRQGGATVVASDPNAARARVRGVRGVMGIEAALKALLDGSGFEARRVDDTVFLVQRATRARREHPAAATTTPAGDEPDIVVTAVKIRQPLDSFAGTAHVLSLDEPGLRNAEARGSRAIIDQLPVMASTGLGPGRDKLFVRGIADSSFTGPTQATVGQYLGEVRLNYNAPDPSLALYDLSAIEVLEGPQATLYGAGSLGGVLRLVPRRPAPGKWEGELMSSMAVAANGRFGSELAGVLNVPLATGTAARFVAYASTVPGAVDDTERRLRAVGRSRTLGGRAAIAADLGNAWSIETTGIYQRIDHADARYAEGRGHPPSRASPIAQPAGNTLASGSVTLRKTWDGGLALVSTSSLVRNDLMARYDLSHLEAGSFVENRNRATVLSHETRLVRSIGRGGWLLGVHGVLSSDILATTLGDRESRLDPARANTGVADVGLFGQATLPLAPRWSVTLGGRLSYAEVRVSSALPTTFDASRLSVLGGSELRVLPSAAVGFHPHRSTTAYIRYQRGYRVGGLAIVPFFDPDSDLPTFSVDVFRPDALDMLEAGIRFGHERSSTLSGTLAVSATRWTNIQADLFDGLGPYTTNIGDGRILGLEGSIGWRATPSLTISAAAFLADSLLLGDDKEEDTAPMRARREWLPNIPLATARLDAEWRGSLGNADLTLRGRLRYVGRSRLGVGRELSVRQGNYLDTGVGAEIGRGSRVLLLEADNLLDVRGNTFALGNPFTASRGNQRIPLQPRTFRIGARFSF